MTRFVRLFNNLSAFARGGLRFAGRRRYIESGLRVVALVVLGAAAIYGGYIAVGIALAVLVELVRMLLVFLAAGVTIAVGWVVLSVGSSAYTKPTPVSKPRANLSGPATAGPRPGIDEGFARREKVYEAEKTFRGAERRSDQDRTSATFDSYKKAFETYNKLTDPPAPHSPPAKRH
jgi:uncharacterized membrane protein